MGMDVNGKNPSSEEGSYFRANVWSWRPIHAIIGMTGVVDDETLNRMSMNEGAGLQTQNECNQLADALEKVILNNDIDIGSFKSAGFVLERKDNDVKINFPICEDKSMVVKPDGTFVKEKEIDTMTLSQQRTLRSAYSTTYSHLKEFIAFLRSCGGFEVC